MHHNTPILFLTFNRPEITELVFEEIRKVKPSRLYVASDGPRATYIEDIKKIKQTRDIVNKIDWKCDLKELFRDENLGCGRACSEAVSWFFDNEEEGIILEDDTLPRPSFFEFCQELLDKYRDDTRVWHISGHKHLGIKSDDYSYNFSNYPQLWGWATWRRAWQNYEFNLSSSLSLIENSLNNYNIFRSDKEIELRIKILKKVLSGRLDTWDYQWEFTIRINNGLSIRPSVNLVENIGFGEAATHTKKSPRKKYESEEMNFPLQHPNFICANAKLDKDHFKFWVDDSLLARLKRDFRNWIR
jgi:hypothetical protein